MTVEITAADRDRIIRNLAKSGKPAPAWVKDDPHHLALYDQAKAAAADPQTARPAAPAPPAGRAPATPAGGPKTAKPAAPQAKPARKTGSRTRRASNAVSKVAHPAGPAAAPASSPAIRQATGGLVSTGGGLLLAVFTYPIALALFQHGPAGLSMWLKAKFLNRDSTVGSGAVEGITAAISQTATAPALPATPVPAPWQPGFAQIAKGRGAPPKYTPPAPSTVHGSQVP